MFSIFKKSVRKEPNYAEQLAHIDFKGGTKYAKNETNNVYLDIEELGGFPYIKTVIIGDFSVKIKRLGCTITFKFGKDSLTLSSDNTTIESNQIQKSSISYTEIDFELNDDEVEKIKTQKVNSISYTFKNKTITFKPIV